MVLNPTLRIGNAEVTSVNPVVKSIHIMVHITGNPKTMDQHDIRLQLGQQSLAACHYLLLEGFISDPSDGWMTHIAGIFHSHQHQN